MNLRRSTLLLFLLVLITVCTTMLHADAVSGSLPLTAVIVHLTGGENLKTATTFKAVGTMTSGFGTGDFAPFNVALGTPFGPFTLTDTTVSTGGGFSISNPGLGTFAATGGSILNETPEFLVVDLAGTYTPGPLLIGETAAPAHVVLGFTEIDGATSASMAMATTPVPEPGTLVTMGTGLCGIVGILAVECWFDYRRHNLLHRTRIGVSQAGAMRAPACAQVSDQTYRKPGFEIGCPFDQHAFSRQGGWQPATE